MSICLVDVDVDAVAATPSVRRMDCALLISHLILVLMLFGTPRRVVGLMFLLTASRELWRRREGWSTLVVLLLGIAWMGLILILVILLCRGRVKMSIETITIV